MIESFKLGKPARSLHRDSSNADLKGRLLRTDRRAATRIALVVATVLATVIAIALTLSHETRLTASTSISRTAPIASTASPALSLEQFAATWRASVNRSAEQITLSWSANDSRDLRASLIALDTTGPKSPRITVTRRDTSFIVSAELTP